MSAPHIASQDLALTFPPDVRALEGVTFSIERGEFVSLLGPSGCGKSTLLRLVAGLLQPTGGTLQTPDWTAGTERLGFVFQQPNLLPWRRLEKNLALPLELQRPRPEKAAVRASVASALARVGLAEFPRAWPHQLSGGMQMRASLARALVADPDLLLLDEPFGALDEITRQRLNEDLLGLWGERRFTALFVTHNVFEAVFLSQRILVMSARPGRIAAEIAVPFAYPREASLRAEPEFARLVGAVSGALVH